VVGAAVVVGVTVVVVGPWVVVSALVVVGAPVVVRALTGDAAACAGRITDCTTGRTQEFGIIAAIAPVPTAFSSGRRSNLILMVQISPLNVPQISYGKVVASQHSVTLNS
jgi:hypothetical protein